MNNKKYALIDYLILKLYKELNTKQQKQLLKIIDLINKK